MPGAWCILSAKEDTLRSSSGVNPGNSPFSRIYINGLPNCLEYATPRPSICRRHSRITVAEKSNDEVEVRLNHDLISIKKMAGSK